MREVRSVGITPTIEVFRASGGTPLVLDTVLAIPYILLDDQSIVDLRTGAVVGAGVEEDLRFPATLVRLGALNKPDFDYTNVGLLFPQNDTSEVIYMNGQLPHAYAQHPRDMLGGTPIIPHVHFIQTSSAVPVFKLAYKWYNNGEVVPANFTTITTNALFAAYPGSGNFGQIALFPAIDGTGKKASSVLHMKVWREDNVVAGDALVTEFDIHYLAFSQGTIR